MGVPHAIVLPLPSQGHVVPLMELSHRLVDHGFKVTFVNIERIHDLLVKALANDEAVRTSKIRLVAVPDGLEPEDDSLMKLVSKGLAKNLFELVAGLVAASRSPEGEGDEVKCLIYDGTLHCLGLRVARAIGIRAVVFSSSSALVTLGVINMPKLLEDGIVDEDGAPTTDEPFSLVPGTPPIKASHLPWNCLSFNQGSDASDNIFRFFVKEGLLDQPPDMLICNSFPAIESAVFDHANYIVPVGPLLRMEQGDQLAGNLWPEDHTCVTWLNEQAPGSVVYVAFGSTTKFSSKHFQELALGLEISDRPFLLVVRPDFIKGELGDDVFLEEFKDRVAQKGKVVDWAPQQQVLAHPAIACYMSHGGWNSLMEGLANGIPFLTWAYHADNNMNEYYVCDVWKTGLRLEPDANGLVPKEQVKSKIEELLGDEKMKERALELKQKVIASINKGGSSYESLEFIANSMKN